MLKLWGISLPSLPGPLCEWVVAPDRALSMGQIERFDIQTGCRQMTYSKLTGRNWTAW